ncbi:hypothetical protein ES703_72295 [subsurface metagenome]
MATVVPGQFREQLAHFGLYRTSAGGDESIIVRRKVGEPTDYMHPTSRKLKIQRQNLALASQHYAHLSPSQKAATRHQIEEVEYQTSHGKTDTKLLLGRQLFIAKDIHQLNVAQRQIQPPLEACIILTDQGLNPLDGELWLRYLKDEQWHDIPKEELALGSWMFEKVPARQEAYQVYGEATGFFDLKLPEHQAMTESYLRTYHYHVLFPSVLPYGWTFAAGWWVQNHKTTPRSTHSILHIHSKLKTYDFSGTVTVALWSSPYPYPPEDMICCRTHPVSPADDVYQDYYTTFSGLAIQKGITYWIRHWKSDYNTDLWRGRISYGEF